VIRIAAGRGCVWPDPPSLSQCPRRLDPRRQPPRPPPRISTTTTTTTPPLPSVLASELLPTPRMMTERPHLRSIAACKPNHKCGINTGCVGYEHSAWMQMHIHHHCVRPRHDGPNLIFDVICIFLIGRCHRTLECPGTGSRRPPGGHHSPRPSGPRPRRKFILPVDPYECALYG